ncbi:MAG: helix-turn-helix domain-containing protein [Firmicutes bacterium]|nr:helix-turn-helix domain-containing protein [Bacillota bacterium]
MDPIKTGKFIQELRKAKKLTQNDLADLLQVTNKAVSRWETGEGFPDILILPRLSEILSITIDEILRGEIIENPESINMNNKQVLIDATQKNQKKYFLFIIPMIAIICSTIISILVSDNSSMMIVLYLNILFILIILIYSLSVIYKKKETYYSEEYIPTTRLIVNLSLIALSFSAFKLFSPFLASSTYYKHIAEYTIIGLCLGYIINRLLISNLYSPSIYKNTASIRYLTPILITFGVAVFTIPDYFGYLLETNFILIGLALSCMFIIFGVSVVLKIKKNTLEAKFMGIAFIIFLGICGIYLWLIIYGILDKLFSPFMYISAIVQIISLLVLLIMSILLVLKKINLERYFKSLSVSMTVFTFILFLRFIPMNIGSIVEFPSLIASVPHSMKLYLSIMLIPIWSIELLTHALSNKGKISFNN